MDATHHTLLRQISINQRFSTDGVGGSGGDADDTETEKVQVVIFLFAL